MKKIIFIGVFIIAIGAAGWVLYTQKIRQEQGAEEAPEISYYTCPMHHQIHKDHPGDCPICHMKLVPVYEERTSPNPRLNKERERGGVTISPERQQLIGLRTVAAEKKPAIQEIRTVGRVAFDPELAIAQTEFVEIAKNVPSLKSAAVSRLKLLGMGDQEIRDLTRKGKVSSNLTLPEPGDSVWIYATLYQGEIEAVQPGQEASIVLPSGGEPFTGIVRAVDRVIDPTTRSARARIEVLRAGGVLRPESYLNVVLKIDLGIALTIPKSAVIDTGTRKVAFVVGEDNHFQSRDITTGSEVGDEIVVLEGLQEGEKVVSSAAFFVDSESQLKAAVSDVGKAPTCPEGEAWDSGMSMCMPKAGG